MSLRMLLVVLLVAVGVPVERAALAADGLLEVVFLDVGQADATLLAVGDTHVLIDTGGWRGNEVVDHLAAEGIDQFDLVVITHPHADHIGQLDRALDVVEVDAVWWSGASTTSQTFQRALDALEVSGAAYLEPRVGHTDTFGPLGVEVLNPPAGVGLSDVHDSALATRITFGDTRWLLTGDIEADVEQRMVDTVGDQLHADVHQVGHHGSTTSTTPVFLEAVDPTVAVYSAGQDNTYGHPQTEVLDRLNTSGVQVYGTDANGTVTATGDGTSIRFVPQVGDSYTHTVDDPADPPADVPVDPVPSFTDIAGSGHEQAILVVAQAYIAGGFTDGAYRVAIFVTRGQMATFLTRALKLTPTDPPYPDAAGTTHAQAIGAVPQANIAGGYGDGTYRPGEPVTRGRMATFLARVFDLEVVG